MLQNEIGPLSIHDDLDQAARLIYETDPYIYPGVFGPWSENALHAIRELLFVRNNIYAVKNIIAARNGSSLCGIAVINDGSSTWNLQEIEPFIEKYGLDMGNFRYASEKYFFDAAKMAGQTAVEIVCLSVASEYRHRGIGGNLIGCIKKKYSSRHLILEVLAENQAAVSLYKKNGFCITDSYPGFNLEGLPCSLCCRMECRNDIR